MARFTSLQEALLAPLRYETVDAWCRAVLQRAETLFRADRSAMFLPIADQIHYVSESIDPRSMEAFQRGIEEQQPGALRFAETLVDRAWAARRAKGIEVWSIPMLGRLLGRPIEEVAMYHEAVKPAGLTHSVVATTAVPAGEAFLGVSHSHPDDDPFGEPARLELMGMLVPAFKAGVAALLRLNGGHASLGQVFEALDGAVMLCDASGHELYQSTRLVRLLAAEPEAEHVRRTMRSLGRSLVRPRVRRLAEAVPRGLRDIQTGRSRYRVTATYARPGIVGATDVVLIAIERLTPALPDPTDLVEHHGLTRREAEVALLLAQGFSNRDVARRLVVSPSTVRHHAEGVFSKLGIHTRKALALVLLGGGAYLTVL